MKRLVSFIVAALFAATTLLGQSADYDRHFTPDRLRIDLSFAGNAAYQKIYLEGLAKECRWSGPKKTLVDPFGYGEYRLEIKDLSGTVLYSTGFNTLFQEWRTTPEAARVEKSFSCSFTVPYPKEKVQLCLSERVKATGKFQEIFQAEIDPADKLISHEADNNYKVSSLIYNGESEHKVDLLLLAEGYTAAEMDKFKADARKFSDYLFTMDPYKSHRKDFNIWIVESVSEESGTDLPHRNIWKKTVMSSNFYTFYTDRYLTIQDQSKVVKAACNAPHDALYVIANTEEYGGGGIYNFYNMCASDAPFAKEVFIHEFGHGFAGLADEYYDSSTAFEDFYNLKVEPWEPNITTLVDFGKKWKDMLSKDVAVPTAPTPEEDRILGVYEGGGYMEKGVYRGFINCRMKTNTAEDFCPVCRRAIEQMILFYAQ